MQSVLTADRPSPAPEAPHTSPIAHQNSPASLRRTALLRPGWPLTALLVGYPLWWLLGLGEILPLVAAGVMGMELARMRPLAVKRGFGLWLLFLAWVIVGVVLLQVNAPGAIPGGSSTRYITFAFRLGWYLAATVVLLYIYNMRERLSTARVTRAFGWLFVTVVAGGVLGTVAPRLNFPSLLELILGRATAKTAPGLIHIQFVHDLIHPVVAQLYSVGGHTNPRASAPFAYTNEWGLNFACLLPFFLVGWLGRDAGWRRKAAPVVLVLALYPVVASQNRGLWLALVLSGVLVAVRAALMGRVRLFGAFFAAGLVFVAIVFATPLGGSITHRLANGTSNSGRSSLGTETVNSVIAKSPVVGLGTTRNVQGSVYSIAGGNSADCQLCTPPALGTQGHLWLVIFSTGVGGLVLYLGFFVLQFRRYLRLPGHIGTLGLSVIVTHLSTMSVYDTIGIAFFSIFAAVALLWRASPDTGKRQAHTATPIVRDQTIRDFGRLMRANAVIVVVCLSLGLAGGYLFQRERGIQATAITSVQIPTEPRFSAIAPPQTMDTIAGLIDTTGVLDAVSAAAGRTVAADDSRLYVTARPNTRVLDIHFSDPNAHVADAATEAAARALLVQRQALLRREQTDALSAFGKRQISLQHAVATLVRVHPESSKLVTDQLELLATHIATVGQQMARISSTEVAPGTIIELPHARPVTDVWLVSICSGLMIGLVVSVLLAQARGIRVGRRNRAICLSGLSVLGRLPGTGSELLDTVPGAEPSRDSRTWQTLTLLGQVGTATYLSADDSEPIQAAAWALERAVAQRAGDVGGTASRNQAVLVAGARTQTADIDALRARLELGGAAVRGLVLVEQEPVRQKLNKTVRGRRIGRRMAITNTG